MKRDTFDKLTELEYPVTRPFPASWRCFGPIVLMLCSPVLLVLLTLLNVSTVGRESVAVESPQFADDSRSWWAVLSGTLSARACEPHHFLLGDVFRTNLGSFDYSLVSVDLSNGKTEAADIAASAPSNLSFDAPAYGFEYRMGSVVESCYSSNATSTTSFRSLIVTADLSTFTVNGVVTFFCSNSEGSIVQLRLSHLTKPLEPSMGDYQTSMGLNPDVQSDGHRLVVRGLVDLMAVDLLQSMRFAFAAEEQVTLTQITALARMDCQAAPSLLKPVDLECPFYAQIPFIESSVGRVSRAGDIEFIDLGDSSVTYPAGLTVSQHNYFSILASASLIDIGKWAGNPLLSRDWFNVSVDPNDDVSVLYRNQQGLRSVVLGNASFPTPADSLFYNQSLSNAAVLRSPPTMVLNDTLLAPPVWAVNYLCRTSRLKGALELVISVLVADVSLFTAVWAIFMIIATALARQKADSSSPASADKSSPNSGKPVLPPLDGDPAQQTLLYNPRISTTATTATSPTSLDHGIGEAE